MYPADKRNTRNKIYTRYCHVRYNHTIVTVIGHYATFCIEIINIANIDIDVNRDGAFEISKYFRCRKSGSVKFFLQLRQLLDFAQKSNTVKNGEI